MRKDLLSPRRAKKRCETSKTALKTGRKIVFPLLSWTKPRGQNPVRDTVDIFGTTGWRNEKRTAAHAVGRGRFTERQPVVSTKGYKKIRFRPLFVLSQDAVYRIYFSHVRIPIFFGGRRENNPLMPSLPPQQRDDEVERAAKWSQMRNQERGLINKRVLNDAKKVSLACTDGQTDGQTDRQTDERTGRQTGRQADGQTDTHTPTHPHAHAHGQSSGTSWRTRTTSVFVHRVSSHLSLGGGHLPAVERGPSVTSHLQAISTSSHSFCRYSPVARRYSSIFARRPRVGLSKPAK